jgi:hypothetical protein
MDNAKCYLSLGADQETRSLVVFWTEKHPVFDLIITAVESKQLVRKHIAVNKESEITCLAENGRPNVLFTPSYYNNQQTIELVWAYATGKVDRQYSIDTLKIVNKRLTKVFGKLEEDHKVVIGIIEKSIKSEKQF